LPYQALLDELLRTVHDAEGALLLDGTGEVVLGSGAMDERQRLIGAYEGIALSHVRRVAKLHGLGSVQYMLWRHREGTVILRPLKDDYFLVVQLGVAANVARSLVTTGWLQERIDQEL
jgi:predicted regulator of Ras-like GTPase activity (Roadblock/LC7/MglB family)